MILAVLSGVNSGRCVEESNPDGGERPIASTRGAKRADSGRRGAIVRRNRSRRLLSSNPHT